MAWETTFTADFGSIAVVAGHNGGQRSVRIVKPYTDGNGDRSLNVSGRIGGVSIVIPQDADPTTFGPLAEAVAEAMASLPEPEPKADKPASSKGKGKAVTVKQADPQVIAALAANPAALTAYLSSLS